MFSSKSMPGLFFLIKSSPSVILPLLSIRGAFFLVSEYLPHIIPSDSIPNSIRAACYFLSIPSYFASRLLWGFFQNKVKVRYLGCVEVPALQGRLGNIDFVRKWGAALKGRSYLCQTLEENFVRLGPVWNARVLWQDVIHVSQPEHMKAMLVNDFQSFGKGKDVKKSYGDLFGTGIVNTDGELWQYHRSMVRPFFAREKAAQYSIFQTASDKAISLLLQRREKGLSTDIQELFGRYTFDSTVEFIFAIKLSLLDQQLSNPHYFVSQSQSDSSRAETIDADASANTDAVKFSKALGEAEGLVSDRNTMGAYWPLGEFWSNATAQPMKIVDDFIYKVFETHAKTAEELKDVKEEDLSLLDHLSRSTNDRTLWKDELLNLFVAGRDTSSALTTFAVYALANNPDVMKRLRAEILSALGSDGVPSFDDIKNMKYLRSVVNETLRMYPPIPVQVREAVKDTTFPPVTPGGLNLFIPAKARVLYSVIIMHRRQDLWGPDAHIFDPDRWLDERLQTYFLANPFIFLPFGAGPRICPGQQFAINEASFMIVRLLQRFENIELDMEAQPPKWRMDAEWTKEESISGLSKEKILMKSKVSLIAPGGVWVKLQPVSAA